jgi:hypothetical protein
MYCFIETANAGSTDVSKRRLKQLRFDETAADVSADDF